jgi:DNA mismatch repair protein MutS2
MLYPKNIEYKLGFDQVREHVRALCLGPNGAAYADKMRFSDKYALIRTWLLQVVEFKRILLEDTPFPQEHYIDVHQQLNLLRLEGAFLSESQFHSLKLSLKTIQMVTEYFANRPGTYPEMQELLKEVNFDKSLIQKISAVIDEEGKMKPSASPELLDIHRKTTEKEGELRRKMNSLLKKAQENGWAADTGITVRDGRIVLAILAEHKRKIRGFVHDESSTGQTLYIEPAEALELNSAIRELSIAKKREIDRILLRLTDQIRPALPALELYYAKLAIIDFIRAKALFANNIQAVMPLLSDKPGLEYVDAVNPILLLSHLGTGHQVIPLNVSLTAENRIVVVSGPNAGGKSVALKTIGLLQLMLQSGLLVPLKDHSRAGIFQEIFADIGDEQSIENDLSTYSSHLKNMKHFVNFSTPHTLFLIDEFGTGTDPQFGGPIAEVILQHLNEKQAMGVVTTHYSNLKVYANNTPGIINASMAFDSEKLQPLFRLEMGKPGSSYALEVAQKIGLNRKIIAQAKEKVGRKQQDIEQLLVKLERDKIETAALTASLKEKDAALSKLLEQYNSLSNELETNKKKIIKEAKEQAVMIIRNANQQVENTIREIREGNAGKESTQVLRQKLHEETKKLNEDIQKANEKPVPAPKHSPAKGEIIPGSLVRIKGQENTGEVVEINRNNAVVSFGILRSTVKLEQLEKVEGAKAARQLKAQIRGLDMNAKLSNYSSNLDLRGKRGEEAVSELMTFIDQSIMLGFEDVRIIHGKGHGILRQLIRENLKRIGQVVSVTEEHVEMGGAGVTLVKLR